MKNMKAKLKSWVFENHNFDVSSKKILHIRKKRNTFLKLMVWTMHGYNFKEHILKHKS